MKTRYYKYNLLLEDCEWTVAGTHSVKECRKKATLYKYRPKGVALCLQIIDTRRHI